VTIDGSALGASNIDQGFHLQHQWHLCGNLVVMAAAGTTRSEAGKRSNTFIVAGAPTRRFYPKPDRTGPLSYGGRDHRQSHHFQPATAWRLTGGSAAFSAWKT